MVHTIKENDQPAVVPCARPGAGRAGRVAHRQPGGAHRPAHPGRLRGGRRHLVGARGHAEEPQAFKAGLYNLALRFPQVVLVPTW